MTTKIGSRIRCLARPSWAPPDYDRMVGQVGRVISVYPPDPDYPDDPGGIGVQYPLSPFSDNTIALDRNDQGITWEQIN